MIEPDFLDELDRFDAALDRRVSSLFRGEHRSSRLGEGLTFRDYRSYVPGDDPRLLDWNLYARTDELYVKQFEAERNLTVHVLLDASESMGFGDEDKFEYGAKVGLGYCYLTARENDDFSLAVVGDDFERLDGGASTTGEVLRLVDLLNEVEPAGSIDFPGALAEYDGTIRSRSLVVVASDFLADPEDIAAGLEAVAGNELVVVHVVAPEELEPPVRGDTIFEGVEQELEVRTYVGPRTIEAYRRRLERHWTEVESIVSDLDATYVRVDTGQEFFESFASAWIG